MKNEEQKPTTDRLARAEINRARRYPMRSWALLWRAEVVVSGSSAMASMCLRNAIGWRDIDRDAA